MRRAGSGSAISELKQTYRRIFMSEKSPFVPIVFILATLVCLFIARVLPYIDANGSWHIGAGG